MASTKRGGLSQEEQEKYFNDACEAVRKNAFYMQQQLDSENLHDALRYASTMINELRTSKLYPTRYYEVYMNVTAQLSHLESYIDAEFKKKLSVDASTASVWLSELYDRVQYCGNIVPRLYLLITVASICLKVHKNEHEETMRILFDLVSLTKGVQHPTRGLFLRNYLSQVSRLVIPDVPERVNAESLDNHPIIKKAVDFILQNFAEMTRLWVRMQHQGAVRDRTKRERERLQLRMLVGTNLRRLSELNVVSAAIYRNYVLKKVTEQIVKCKDRIAQEYLMECLIMVFSDEYHLGTLEGFLSVVNKLQSSVNVNSIIIKLMERLSKYAEHAENKEIFLQKDIFGVFQNYCKQIITKHKKMTLDDILALYVELVNFAAQCYPGRDEYIGTMMDETLSVIVKHCGDGGKVPLNCVSHIHRMLVSPIKAMNLRVLQLNTYCILMSTLPSNEDIKSISCDVIQVLTSIAVDQKIHIKSPQEIEKLFNMIHPLLYDDEDELRSKKTKRDDDEEEHKDDDEFIIQQNLVAALVHLIRNNESTDIHYKSLHLARKYFGKGGDRRLLYTFPPLVFNCLRLIQVANERLNKENIENDEHKYDPVTVKPKKMFQFVHQICTAYGSHNPEIGVRLWLQGALGADKCGFSDICYEFLSQSFLCFEEHVSDSSEQYEAIRCITGSLQQIKCLDEENFDTLRSKAVSHSNRLLKKPCAAQCFILCSNLYINTPYVDTRVSCKCLIKACKRASQMMEGIDMISIFIQVLNKYIYCILNKTEQEDEFEYDKVSQLIDLIKEKITEQQSQINIDSDDDEKDLHKLQEIKQFFRLTTQYITDLTNSNDEQIAQNFSKIQL